MFREYVTKVIPLGLQTRLRSAFRMRLGSLVLMVALGWPVILPALLALDPHYVEFEFLSLPALVWMWFPAAVVALIGLFFCLIPGPRHWRVPVPVVGVVLALVVAGSLRVGYERGVDLWARVALLGSHAVPALLQGLAKETASSRITARSRAAGDAVSLLGHRGLPRVVEGLQHSEWAVRTSAARVLAQMGPDAASARAALVQALKDPDVRVRTAAADAVLRVAPEARTDVSILIDIVNAGESLARGDAASALAELGPQAAPAVPALISGLRDPYWATRAGAAKALGKIGPAAAAAVSALTEALRDPIPNVRSSAAEALERVRGS